MASKTWPLAGGSSEVSAGGSNGGSAEVTLAASGRKAGTNKSVSFAKQQQSWSSLHARNAGTKVTIMINSVCYLRLVNSLHLQLTGANMTALNIPRPCP